jgi:enolase
MASIEFIGAREILDSRGNPTVELRSFSTTAPRAGGRSVGGFHRRL